MCPEGDEIKLSPANQDLSGHFFIFNALPRKSKAIMSLSFCAIKRIIEVIIVVWLQYCNATTHKHQIL